MSGKGLKHEGFSVSFPKEGHMFLFRLNLSLYRCGSLIFDVVLKFGTKVAEDDTISFLQSSIVDGKLGELSVNVSYIHGIPPVGQSTTAAPTRTTLKSDGLFLVVTNSGILNFRVASVLLTRNQLFCAEFLYSNIDKFGYFKVWPQSGLFTWKCQFRREKTWLMFISKFMHLY